MLEYFKTVIRIVDAAHLERRAAKPRTKGKAGPGQRDGAAPRGIGARKAGRDG